MVTEALEVVISDGNPQVVDCILSLHFIRRRIYLMLSACWKVLMFDFAVGSMFIVHND